MIITLYRMQSATFWHDYDSDYLELFQLPNLGPSACWLLRRLHVTAPARPEDAVTTIDAGVLAQCIGLSAHAHRPSLDKAIQRLTLFHMVEEPQPYTIGVPERVQWLTDRQVERLPAVLQHAHAALRPARQEAQR